MKKATRFRNIFFLGKEGSGVCCETGRFRNTLKQCIDHLGVKRRILAEAARIFGVHPSTVCRLLAASAQGSHENDTRVPNIAERIRLSNSESITSRWSHDEVDLFVLLSPNRIK